MPYQNYVPNVKTGHVAPGVTLQRLKERLSQVKGALVEAPLVNWALTWGSSVLLMLVFQKDFLIDERDFVLGPEWRGLNPIMPIYIWYILWPPSIWIAKIFLSNNRHQHYKIGGSNDRITDSPMMLLNQKDNWWCYMLKIPSSRRLLCLGWASTEARPSPTVRPIATETSFIAVWNPAM